VGEQSADIITTKNLLLRLQAPRFFVEKDEVTLSAIVHNYFDETKQRAGRSRDRWWNAGDSG
jgi:alpha-2-macroglobulin